MRRRTCNYVGDKCLAPAGIGVNNMGWAEGDTSTRLTCYVCGAPICAECSRLTTWYGKRVRAGYCCIPEEDS